ncbi:type IV pilus secretin PilQ [Francisella frigiditurris]|uniref:Type IV pilus secretin PilQ family protein n=1 Tax=Francisella frigiditurris TaxID=1542390 RepID=A0A1J0KTY5_9GAMM|nr:secretin N-terminal domain-containing protein [Francisella frigiditurris]APC97118.1 type IV pilus secretin PilQ family protein [Francisella frigiditurris]
MFFKKKFFIISVLFIFIFNLEFNAFAADTISSNIDSGQSMDAVQNTEKESSIVGREANVNTTSKRDTKYHIKNIEFHRSLNGGAVLGLVFDTEVGSYSNFKTELSKDGYTMKITLKDTSISDSWISDMNTTVFNTIVDSIKISHPNNKSETVFEIHSLDRIAFSDNRKANVLEFKFDRQKSRVEGFNIYEPITVSFKDTPIETVLQVLAEFAGLNLVVSSSVRGNISIDLKNVPWNEVMNIILVSKGLATKKMNSILYVAPAPEIAAQEQLEVQTKRSLENNAVLITEFIPLNYTTATSAQTVITSMANQNGGIMSSRGSITSDVRTNTLIVTDTEANIPKIKEVIKEIDVPNDQVLVEARIVEVSRTASLDLAFNYEIRGPGDSFNFQINTFTPPTDPATGDMVYGKFGGTVGNGVYIGMEIKAQETEGNANLVSSPHLIVSNNETAFIKQGTDVPYNQSTASGAASVAFQEAVLELQVTPQIAPDGYMIMELLVTKNSVLPGKEGQPPPIEKREITTKIMAQDGQTIVIGGIYDKEERETQLKVPLLGDIPYLGYLFSNTHIENLDKELLIFITPKIIQREVV